MLLLLLLLLCVCVCREDRYDVLTVCDWGQKIGHYHLSGKQVYMYNTYKKSGESMHNSYLYMYKLWWSMPSKKAHKVKAKRGHENYGSCLSHSIHRFIASEALHMAQ